LSTSVKRQNANQNKDYQNDPNFIGPLSLFGPVPPPKKKKRTKRENPAAQAKGNRKILHPWRN